MYVLSIPRLHLTEVDDIELGKIFSAEGGKGRDGE